MHPDDYADLCYNWGILEGMSQKLDAENREFFKSTLDDIVVLCDRFIAMHGGVTASAVPLGPVDI